LARKSEDDWYKVALGRNTDGLGTLAKALASNRFALKDLGDKFISQINFVNKLTEVFHKSEALQLRSLTLGTTYSKFVEKNTKALENSRSNTQELTDALLTGFGQGLRDNTNELDNLIDSMNFQGQNVALLTGSMADLAGITGNSKDVQSKLVKTLESTSDDYGVANDKLVRGLATLQTQLTKMSLFGEGAVGNFADFKTALMGRTGGKGGDAMDTLLAALDPANLEQQQVLGLRPLADAIRQGNFTNEEGFEFLRKAAEHQERLLPKNDFAKAKISENLGRPVITASQNLVRLMGVSNKLSDSEKKSGDDERRTLKAQQNKVDNWYNTYAPGMHGAIVRWLPAIAAGLVTSASLGAATRGAASLKRWSKDKGIAKASAGALASKASVATVGATGASTVLARNMQSRSSALRLNRPTPLGVPTGRQGRLRNAKAGRSNRKANARPVTLAPSRSATRTTPVRAALPRAASVATRLGPAGTSLLRASGLALNFIPVIGTAAGLAMMFWPEILEGINYLRGGSDAEKEALELKKREESKTQKTNPNIDSGLKAAVNFARLSVMGDMDKRSQDEMQATLLRIEKAIIRNKPLPQQPTKVQ
jgi:hypothetical protein